MEYDLDANGYTIEQLVSMFNLPENYTCENINQQHKSLAEQITNNENIENHIKLETIRFLTQAQNLILKDLTQKTQFQQKIADFYNSSFEMKPTEINQQTDHMIQVRKENPYLSSYPSEFFPGIINTLKKKTTKKNLNIDTRFRENYFSNLSTNFNFNMPIKFSDVVQMQLSTIEIPLSYYVVSKQYDNNYFNIKVNNLSQTVTIPNGNYSNMQIIDAINFQLTNLGIPFSDVSFAIDVPSNKTLVGPKSSVGIHSIELNFVLNKNGIVKDNTPLPLKFGWLLGFRNGIYTENLNYVSEGSIDLTGPKYLYLVLDDFNTNVNNSFYGAFNSSILNKNILARISIPNGQNFATLTQNNLNLITTPREYFGPVNIQSIHVELLDEFGRVVNLNNMDFSFCLTFTTLYDL